MVKNLSLILQNVKTSWPRPSFCKVALQGVAWKVSFINIHEISHRRSLYVEIFNELEP